jgi:hypothetical protein
LRDFFNLRKSPVLSNFKETGEHEENHHSIIMEGKSGGLLSDR